MKTLRHILLAVLLGQAQFTFAQEHTSEHDEEGYKQGFGIGVAVAYVDDETHLAYGIEYEYKFTPHWGIGFLYENTEDAKDGNGIELLAAMGYYHINHNWRLEFGLGDEKTGGFIDNNEPFARLGVSYEFHLRQGGVIAPTFAVDFVDGETNYVLGVAFVATY